MVRCALCIIRNRFILNALEVVSDLSIMDSYAHTHIHVYTYIRSCLRQSTLTTYTLLTVMSTISPTINSFMFLQVVYPQMATNTTGKVNLGQEGKPTYYNCVLHVYALIKKI